MKLDSPSGQEQKDYIHYQTQPCLVNPARIKRVFTTCLLSPQGILLPLRNVRDSSVSITKSATRHHVLLLNFAVRSDTQNPTLILLEQVMLPPLTPDARINTPESNLNFMKIYCDSNQNANLVRQLITFNASKS